MKDLVPVTDPDPASNQCCKEGRLSSNLRLFTWYVRYGTGTIKWSVTDSKRGKDPTQLAKLGPHLLYDTWPDTLNRFDGPDLIAT